MDASQLDFDTLWDYSLWNYGDPAASEATFRALLREVERDGQPSYFGEVLTQVARAQGLQGQFAAAHETLDRVEALLPEARLRTRVRYLLERGRVWNSSGQPDSARPLFEQAWELSREAEAERYYAVDAAHMLAIVAPPDGQIEWNLRGIELAKSATEERTRWWCASLYNNLGWTYHGLGDFAQALACFEAALEWRQLRGPEREIGVARWCVGRALRSLGRYEEALALQRELLAASEANSLPPGGYVLEEIGENLLALGRAEESQPYFARAARVLGADTWLREHEPARLERLARLAEGATPGPAAETPGE